MIQLFRPKFRNSEIFELIEKCLEVGWTGQGFLTKDFEEKFSEYLQKENVLFLNSASSAIHLALETFKISRSWPLNSEIISTPLTFVSTNHAIKWANLQPVLVDVDEYLCMDPKSLRENITPRTKAVLFVAIGGNIGRLNEIKEICDENNLVLVLDAAHAAGSRFNGKHVGNIADAVCYSFQAVKNLPTADSGALQLANLEEFRIASKLSWLGISTSTFERTSKNSYKWKYDVDEIGFKYNGNSVMAAMALIGLKYLDSDNAIRREISNVYSSELQDCKGVEIVSHVNNQESSRHLFQIKVKDRDKLSSILNESGIGFGVHYISNSFYPDYSQFMKSTPRATIYSDQIISLPLHLFLDEAQIEQVIDGVRNYSKLL